MYWVATINTVAAMPLNSTTWFARNYYTCLTLLGASRAIAWRASGACSLQNSSVKQQIETIGDRSFYSWVGGASDLLMPEWSDIFAYASFVFFFLKTDSFYYIP